MSIERKHFKSIEPLYDMLRSHFNTLLFNFFYIIHGIKYDGDHASIHLQLPNHQQHSENSFLNMFSEAFTSDY